MMRSVTAATPVAHRRRTGNEDNRPNWSGLPPMAVLLLILAVVTGLLCGHAFLHGASWFFAFGVLTSVWGVTEAVR